MAFIRGNRAFRHCKAQPRVPVFMAAACLVLSAAVAAYATEPASSLTGTSGQTALQAFQNAYQELSGHAATAA